MEVIGHPSLDLRLSFDFLSPVQRGREVIKQLWWAPTRINPAHSERVVHIVGKVFITKGKS